MNSRTAIYLSIIVSAWFIQNFFNPLPFSEYGLEVITVAWFMPYFGKIGIVKILTVLFVASTIKELPSIISIASMWPNMADGVIAFISTLKKSTTTEAFHYRLILPDIKLFHISIIQFFTFETMMNFCKSVPFMLSAGFFQIYWVLVYGTFYVSGVFKKMGYYGRIQL